MKKPLLIGVSALTLLALSATLFAQTTTGSSLITEMKAAVRSFTLAADLNPGITGLQSAPVSGKVTGDMLTAGEWNRVLELVGQGGGGGGAGITLLDTPVTIINDSAASTGTLSLADKVPACATSVILGSRIGILVGNAPRANDAEAYMSINNAEIGRVYLDAALHHTNAYDVSEGIFALSSNKSITWTITTGGNFTSVSKYVFLKGYICGGSGGTGAGGGASWVDVPLTGTDSFDDACQYRTRSASTDSWNYVWQVGTGGLTFKVSTANDTYIAVIPKDEKGFWDYHVNGNSAVKFQEDVMAVAQIQKLCGGASGGSGGGQSNIIKGTASAGFTNGQPHSAMATVSFGRTCTNPVITVQSVNDSIACGTGAGPGTCSNSPGTTSEDLKAYFSGVTATDFKVYLSSMSGVWVGASSPAFGINYIVACD